MDILIYIIAAVVVSVILWFVTRKNVHEGEPAGRLPRAAPRERENIPVVVRRRNNRARILRNIERHQEAAEEESSESDYEERFPTTQKIGAKKQRKLQEKEERRVAREATEREREEKKVAQAERDEARKRDEEKKKAEEEKQLEEEKRLQEEQEKREHEEYLKMKELFEVEEEGEAEGATEEESHHLLEEFISYIRENKVVLMEDLASHFSLRTQAAIDRVQDLLKEGTLTGVIDDRGKFIYISIDELKAVAQFVERRGRISIAELAKASNSLINLNPEKTLMCS